MLRLIIAAVLVSACLAFPENREDAAQDMANTQPFAPGLQGMQEMPAAMPNMQGMQGMPGMPAGQFLPFNPYPGFGFKRVADENLEKRKHQSQFNDNQSPFGSSADGLGMFSFENFMKENPDKLPFANMEGADTADLGNFAPSGNDQLEDQFRFFDEQQ
uniref:Conotoxin n=1 Tax=Conus praecellens TaxID=128530 RepID=A0A291C2A1_CONPC|nr:conotoxin [Conus praecellens]